MKKNIRNRKITKERIVPKRELKRGEIYYVLPLGSDGSVQRNRRPAVLIGNDKGNKHCRVHPVAFITTKRKAKLPTHVPIMLDEMSIILCEHPQSIPDTRIYEYIRTLTDQEMAAMNKALKVALSNGEVRR